MYTAIEYNTDPFLEGTPPNSKPRHADMLSRRITTIYEDKLGGLTERSIARAIAEGEGLIQIFSSIECARKALRFKLYRNSDAELIRLLKFYHPRSVARPETRENLAREDNERDQVEREIFELSHYFAAQRNADNYEGYRIRVERALRHNRRDRIRMMYRAHVLEDAEPQIEEHPAFPEF